MKKYLAVLTIPVAILGFAGTASANPSQASATCQGGIVYEGHAYPPSGNTVTVKIDGATVTGFPKTFGFSTSDTVQFPNKTVGHSWQVVWDRFNGTDGDREQHGTVQACQVAPTTTTTPPTTSTAATTTVPSSTTVVATVPAPTTAPTTTVVAVDLPPVPCAYDIALPADSPLCLQVVAVNDPIPTVPVELGIASRVLPATGGKTDLFLFALGLVVAGSTIALIARRRSQA